MRANNRLPGKRQVLRLPRSFEALTEFLKCFALILKVLLVTQRLKRPYPTWEVHCSRRRGRETTRDHPSSARIGLRATSSAEKGLRPGCWTSRRISVVPRGIAPHPVRQYHDVMNMEPFWLGLTIAVMVVFWYFSGKSR